MNNKGYFVGTILIFSFLVLIISFYFATVQNDSIYMQGTEVTSLISKTSTYVKEEVLNFENLVTQLAYENSVNSSIVPELEQKVKDILVNNLGSDYGINFFVENESIHFSYHFYLNYTVGNSVSISTNKTIYSKLRNFAFLELEKESDEFDVDFLESCVDGCDLESYEETLNNCLLELVGNKSIIFEPIYSEEPYNDGVINSSFIVYKENNWLSENWPYRVRNGTYYSLDCN